MSVLHRLGEGGDQPGRLAHRLRLARDEAVEVGALDELPREEGTAVVLASFVALDHVRMVQPGDGLCLAAEPLTLLGIGPPPPVNHLESDETVEPLLPRLVDDPHAALAEPPQ